MEVRDYLLMQIMKIIGLNYLTNLNKGKISNKLNFSHEGKDEKSLTSEADKHSQSLSIRDAKGEANLVKDTELKLF